MEAASASDSASQFCSINQLFHCQALHFQAACLMFWAAVFGFLRSVAGNALVFDQQTDSCARFRLSLELTDLLVCLLMLELPPGTAACKCSDTECPCRTAASSAS